MEYPVPCMWLDKLVLRYDANGECIEAWYTYTNWEGEYCGREIIIPRTW